jgi:hypothetical protein
MKYGESLREVLALARRWLEPLLAADIVELVKIEVSPVLLVVGLLALWI